MRVNGEYSRYTDIKRGVRQGCVMSPDLFNYYSELILRQLQNEKGFRVGGRNITNIRYADDTVLIAESARDLQRLLDVVVRESEKKGLSINCKKTECLTISKREYPQCALKVNGELIKQTRSFNYLGSLITEDARCVKEIKKRVILAKSAFSKLKSILTNQKMSLETRLRVLHCYIVPVLTYGCEAWSITSYTRSILESCEVWFLRRMMKISWTEKITNEVVFRKAGTRRVLIRDLRSRQMKFLGHVMRKRGLENLALTGKIEGKKSRGRKRILWLPSLQKWCEERGVEDSQVELLHKTQNRKSWHNVITKVYGYGA